VARTTDEDSANQGAHGVARRIDHLGRIVVPSEFRKVFGIREGDLLDMTIEGEGIRLRKLDRSCIFCGSTLDLGLFRGKLLCADCNEALRA
jgi:AbrB family transcriptional regulator, transcriptional pleiotropic regulator of transition state genes